LAIAIYRCKGPSNSLAVTTTQWILSDVEINSFDASLVIYIYIILIFLQL